MKKDYATWLEEVDRVTEQYKTALGDNHVPFGNIHVTVLRDMLTRNVETVLGLSADSKSEGVLGQPVDRPFLASVVSELGYHKGVTARIFTCLHRSLAENLQKQGEPWPFGNTKPSDITNKLALEFYGNTRFYRNNFGPKSSHALGTYLVRKDLIDEAECWDDP